MQHLDRTMFDGTIKFKIFNFIWYVEWLLFHAISIRYSLDLFIVNLSLQKACIKMFNTSVKGEGSFVHIIRIKGNKKKIKWHKLHAQFKRLQRLNIEASLGNHPWLNIHYRRHLSLQVFNLLNDGRLWNFHPFTALLIENFVC